MKKRIKCAVIALLAICCYYFQWGRDVSVKTTISTSWGGGRTEYIILVANRLYIWDRESFARQIIGTCVDNEFRDVRFSYDMGYPSEITIDVYTNEISRKLGIRCCNVRYAQDAEDEYRYNVRDNPEKFIMTVR